MTDKTPGACQCHEKPSPSEFARAEFARSASGRAAVRMGETDSAYAWKVVDMPDDEGWLSDDDMADLGWSPVLQCPNPEQHATGRPRTPDAITDEMVERALVVNTDLRPETVRRMLTAALTEPPARPEGAEDIEALVEESLSGDALSDAQVRALADFLAARLADPTRKGA